MLINEVKKELEEHIIPFWNKLRDDENGGYYGYLSFGLELDKQADKGVILHSRILWFYSNTYMTLGGDELLDYAKHAYEFIKNNCIDYEHGGVYWMMDYKGRPADTIGGIPDSYREAGIAAETGIRHQIPGRVYTFDRQALERLADLIPEKDAAVYRRMILPTQAKKVLTDDLLETIRVFFQNDLNLSTTARQLFLHRNTLLYRMEKIRKATGLDLRRFEDAAVFRLVMCLPEKDT